MRANGLTIKCTARDSIDGQMGEHTKENISMIRNRVLALILGQMVVSMTDSGSTENSMGKASI